MWRCVIMSMTPEKKVKNKVVKYLKAWDAYYFFPATGGYGRSGVPDVIACRKGQFIAIECKAGSNKPTELQKREIENIQKAGGYAIVINETNELELIKILESIMEQ